MCVGIMASSTGIVMQSLIDPKVRRRLMSQVVFWQIAKREIKEK
jgi:hypothetical protein